MEPSIAGIEVHLSTLCQLESEQTPIGLANAATLDQSIEALASQLHTRQTAWNNALTKLGRELEKFTPPQPSCSSRGDTLFRSPAAKAELEKAIAVSLLRLGIVIPPNGYLPAVEEVRDGLQTLNQLQREIQMDNLGNALEWAGISVYNDLTFALHYQAYLSLLLSTVADSLSALDYLQTYLKGYRQQAAFVDRLRKATTLLVSRPSNQQLTMQSARDASKALLTAECERRLKLRPTHDSLLSVVNQGVASEPLLAAASQLTTRLSATEEHLVQLPLVEGSQVHSVFICPVSKTISTVSNPPMRLECGHVISKEVVNDLAGPNNPEMKQIKCPYCPIHTLAKNAVRLYF